MTNDNFSSSSNQQKWSELVKRAQTDEFLHQQLLNDPTPVLQNEGIEIPAGAEARVVEDSGQLQCLFETPQAAAAAAGAELTPDELSGVTGGNAKGASTSKTQSSGGQKYLEYNLTQTFSSST